MATRVGEVGTVGAADEESEEVEGWADGLTTAEQEAITKTGFNRESKRHHPNNTVMPRNDTELPHH